MKEFVKINNTRIRKNTIKRYVPMENNRITVYYSASRNKVDFESFKFESVKERDEMINELDLNFLI